MRASGTVYCHKALRKSYSESGSRSGRTVPAGRGPRNTSAFAYLQRIAKENRRMWKQGLIVRIIYLRNVRLLQ